MTRTVLVAGTASHAGKSTVAAGLCRVLADRGIAVAPFKAQNMSNNARAVPKATAPGFGEIGVSQYVQARAAGIRPTTDMNPVLLKPRGEGASQLVIDGDPVGHYSAGTYYDDHWGRAREAAVAAYERLAADNDVIVAEGAGSIGEINLHERDLANIETARFADAAVLICVDIERGGAFASLYGTIELMPEDVRDRVVGALITKFRGDRALLEDGITTIEDRTGIPVLGVLPYDDPGLPAEDSVSLPGPDETRIHGADDGNPAERAVTVAVPRLPRISNFTDFEPLAREPGVRVAYRPPDAGLGGADAVVLPGTKNTVDDLLALREAGFADALRSFEGPVVGLCGGYQMLGERILDPGVESTADRETVPGLGFLPVETRFSTRKRIEQVTRRLDGGDSGPLAGATGTVSGYEIHLGETAPAGDVEDLFADAGAAAGARRGRVAGTYLHGLFENATARRAFVRAAFRSAGLEPPEAEPRQISPFERAGTLVADHVDAAFLDRLSAGPA